MNFVSLKVIAVHKVFENVAESYDLMNDAMSMGIHRVWKDILLERFYPTQGTKLLDVAGGTGEESFISHTFIDTQPETFYRRHRFSLY